MKGHHKMELLKTKHIGTARRTIHSKPKKLSTDYFFAWFDNKITPILCIIGVFYFAIIGLFSLLPIPQTDIKLGLAIIIVFILLIKTRVKS